jgi:hypothetical protein
MDEQKGAGIMQSPLICKGLHIGNLATHISSIAIPLSLSMSLNCLRSSVLDIIQIEYIKLYVSQASRWVREKHLNAFKEE